ncbi:MAG: phosphotransferase [Pseudomonadota bacterium]
MGHVSEDDPIARALALGCWTAPDHASVLEGGITNHNVRVRDKGHDYVVRLGSDIPEHMILRWNELAISRAAHAAGLSPEVVHSEPGVLVLRYVEAAALAAEDLHDPATLAAAVDLVRELHAKGMHALQGPVLSFWVFHIARTYAAFLRQNGSAHTPLLDTLLDEALLLERRVGPVQLVLGHNDLLPANILRGADRFWLIDWEYGGLNSPLFDLGGLASNAALSRDAEAEMLTRYFGAPPEADLWSRYEAMKCASLLRETLWSMVSEITSTLDFDYAAYSAQYLEAYRAAYSATMNGST